MIYRLAKEADISQMMVMVDQAKEAFKAGGIDQWQKGEPNARGLSEGIHTGQVHVLEDRGRVVAMITLVQGDDPSYEHIDGAWLDHSPYTALHRVCVSRELKGRGLAGRLLKESEALCLARGYHSVRVDTHPDNLSMQRALAKGGYTACGTLRLVGGSEEGDLRLGFQKLI